MASIIVTPPSPDTLPGPSSLLRPATPPFLHSIISKTLRVTTTDTRVFVGDLKCTDKDKNLILAQTHEYRYPSAHELRELPAAGESEANTDANTEAEAATEAERLRVRVSLRSRYIGLVVVPGEHVVRIEVQEGERGGIDCGGLGEGGRESKRDFGGLGR